MLCVKASAEEHCGTLGFLPEPCSPFRMLGSMASISFINKLNSLSQKLNTSYREKKHTETCSE